ncbi:enoyl-CoA hydratase/isomerase family protein [Amycolatopsis sp. GM8]|uniref:enoyl-CoA hydratase/isomerase family protein n=1 Tax=Amycolatopsis sp. GM8 TaxID=2896530 RepID=UPI001F308549|nr:enoyl-CoA hydratase/isomerase family protein [Amycolatopsis sp. GM8]
MGLSRTRDARGVVTFTFDDAPTRNALGSTVLADLDRALAGVAEDAGVRVVVFTGAGTTFSSGADRSELDDPAAVAAATSLLASILERIEASPVPVVARVNGAAYGAGLAIAAAADISVATADGFFGLPEVRFGLVAGPAAAACVGRLGPTAALDFLLTGRRFDADEAVGLFTAVVPRAQLDAVVERRVADLVDGDYRALAATRRLVRRMARPDLAERLKLAAEVAAGR